MKSSTAAGLCGASLMAGVLAAFPSVIPQTGVAAQFAWPQVSWQEAGTSPTAIQPGGFYDIPLTNGALLNGGFSITDIDANNDNLIDDRLDLWLTHYHGGSIEVASDVYDIDTRFELMLVDHNALPNPVEYSLMPGAVGSWPGSGFTSSAAGGVRLPTDPSGDRWGFRLRHRGSGPAQRASYVLVGTGRRDG